MLRFIHKFESGVMMALVVMMAIVLFLATFELGWIIFKDVASPPLLLLEIDELLEIFGLFMLVLIGMELLETIAKTYRSRKTNHAQIVVAVAIIAIARKIITTDFKDLTGAALLGMAAIILALSASYYLLGQNKKRGNKSAGAPGVPLPAPDAATEKSRDAETDKSRGSDEKN